MPFSLSLRTSALYLLFITMLSILSIPVWAKEAPNNGATDNISASPNTSTKQAPLNALPTKVQRANNSNSQLAIYQQLFSLQAQVAKLEAQLNIELKHSSMVEGVKENEDKIHSIQIELSSIQTHLDRLSSEQEKVLNGFEKQLENVPFYTNMWGLIIAAFGALITLLAIFIGYSAKRKVIAEAKAETEKWLEEQDERFRKSSEVILSPLMDKLAIHEADLQKLKARHKQEIAKVARSVSSQISTNQPVSKEDTEQLTESIKDIPYAERSADDWYRSGLVKLSRNEYEEAKYDFEKAIQQCQGKDLEMELFAVLEIGVIEGKLENHTLAINHFTNVIEKSSQLQNPDELRVCTLRNKGVALGFMENKDEAEKIYDELIHLYSGYHTEPYQTEVAIALNNKALLQINGYEYDMALSTLEKLKTLFSNTNNKEIETQLAWAYLNSAYIYNQQKKYNEATNNYNAIVQKFINSSSQVIQEVVVEAMLNRANLFYTLKRYEESETTVDLLINKFSLYNSANIKEKLLLAKNLKAMLMCRKGQNKEAYELQKINCEQARELETAGAKDIFHILKANIAELSLIVEPNKTLDLVLEFEETTNNPKYLLVMKFIRFLLDDVNFKAVLEAVSLISKKDSTKWSFDEIRPYLNRFTGKKRCQIEAIVSFFEEHHDVKRLKSEVEHCEGQEEQAA